MCSNEIDKELLRAHDNGEPRLLFQVMDQHGEEFNQVRVLRVLSSQRLGQGAACAFALPSSPGGKYSDPLNAVWHMCKMLFCYLLMWLLVADKCVHSLQASGRPGGAEFRPQRRGHGQ